MARHKGSVSQAFRVGLGIIAGAAARAIKPGFEIVSVQTTRFPAVFNALKGPQHPQGSSSIAESVTVGTPGRIAQTSVILLEIEKTLVDGAGAAGLAALLKYPDASKAKKPTWRCAAATLTHCCRCCWQPSLRAAACAPGGWPASSSACPVHARESPPPWPKRAPTSTRCTITADAWPVWRQTAGECWPLAGRVSAQKRRLRQSSPAFALAGKNRKNRCVPSPGTLLKTP